MIRNLLTAHRRGAASATILALLAGSSALLAQGAATIDLDAPTIDKWQYVFGGAGATRASASMFGAVGSVGFDDRDAQFYVAFNTGGSVPTGLGAGNYVILSATFTLTLGLSSSGSAPSVIFDGSYDPISTYGTTGEPVNGDDPGRPIELFGVGYRNGLTNVTVANDTPFAPTGASGEGIRNLYPTDFLAAGSLNGGSSRDVSNNVTGAFDVNPFAIGQVAPGDLRNGMIDEDANIGFALNLTNPDVLRYLQLSLNDGRVALMTTSLHQAAQTGPSVYPIFQTLETPLGVPGRLDIQVQIVPEPSPVTLGLLGFGLWVAGWRGRHAVRNREGVLP